MATPSERWRRIEEVCQAALERDAADRPAFIAAACAGDSGLRREVEALLAKEAVAAGFLSTPLAAVAADAVGSAAGSSLIGRRLGVYEIIGALGAGGMGEVYRARDTELGRDVAIKVLPREFVADRDRLARFEREARVLAALNHPNIGAIYGLEHIDGVRALVMELVEGQTLAERIGNRGIGDWRSALSIARQIADALEAAHGKGIVHRDLKPANIKITPAGVVKVLDFGLAKTDAASGFSAADASKSPTLTVGGTRQGVLLGTAAYMSPEQARGQSVDKRADIWAFGCVLYELLAGRLAFSGNTVSDHIAAILEREPDWTALPATTPPAVQRLLRRCLEKDTKRRLHDIADARIEIEDATVTTGILPGAPPRNAAVRLPWSIAAVLFAALLGSIAWNVRGSRPILPARHMTRFTVQPPGASPIIRWFALAPDGSQLVFAAQESAGTTPRLFLRRFDQFDTMPLAGTEGAHNPFFSPDGQWIGFATDDALKKISATAAATPIVLAEVGGISAATWTDQNTIIVSTFDHGLQRVPAAGGPPTPMTTLDSSRHERDHHSPEWLPGGKAVLFTIHEHQESGDTFRLAVQALASGERRVLIDQGFDAHYLPTGHLVYANGSSIFAVPFDAETLAVHGNPVKVLDDVATVPGDGVGAFSVSSDGSLVFLPERPRTADRTLVWVDRSGKENPLPLARRPFTISRLSPDGQRVAFTVLTDSDTADISTYDIATDRARRVSSGSYSVAPIWTPDGLSVTFTTSSDGRTWRLMSVAADGATPPQVIVESGNRIFARCWTPDGRALLYSESLPGRNQIKEVEPGGQPRPLATDHGPSFANVGGAALSPDGRWLALVGVETGRSTGNIYVEPFKRPGPRYQLTVDGGIQPIWRTDGREIVYRNGDAMYSVPVEAGREFVAHKPLLIFRGSYRRGAPDTADYDVAPDGSRFLMVRMGDDELAPRRLNVVVNWADELERLVPTRR
jgi:Tol biopolymer transport system component